MSCLQSLKSRSSVVSSTICFTDSEKYLLWAALTSDHDRQFDLACKIYWNLFKLEPSAATLFPKSMIPSATTDVREDPTFHRMALRFVSTLWLVARHLDELETLDEMLKGIGMLTCHILVYDF